MTEVVVNNKMPASEPHHTEDAASFSYPSPVKEFVINFAKNKGAVVGLIFLLFMVIVAIFAPQIAPHSPVEQFREHMLQAPAWTADGTREFLLGTDEAGRDILSRLIHGSRLSLVIGICAVVLTMIMGFFSGSWVGSIPIAWAA